MALNFPDPATQTPVNTFSPTSTPSASTNGITYLWDGQKWNAQTNGDAAFWQRVGTTLSPATVGDNISTTGDISSADVTASSEVKAPSLLNAATTGDPNITLNADGSTLIRDLQNTAPSMIINGAMQVWQRSTSSAVNGYTSVDRFKYSISNGAFNNEKIDVTGGEPFAEGFRTAYRMTNTTTGTASNAYRLIEHYVEGQNVNASGWNWAASSGKITLSFWVRSSVTQDFMCYLNTEAGTVKSFPVPFSCVANTWTKVTKTIPGDAGITIPNTNARGLAVVWAPYWGTDYTTPAGPTLDQWSDFTGSNRAKDYGTGAGTWGGTTNATFDLTGIQLTATDAPVEFQHEDYATTLRKCQRYYAQGRGFTQGAAAGGRVGGAVYMPVSMRVIPTVFDLATVSGFGNTPSGGYATFDMFAFSGNPNANGEVLLTYSVNAEL